MAPILSSVEVSRPAEEVFAYVTDPARFAEWQVDAEGGRMEGDGPPSVGTRYTTIRRIAGIVRARTTSEITEIRPPRSWAARGTGGPVRETIRYTVEPLGENVGSRVTIELDFEGRGVGRLLVRGQARKEMPINCRMLEKRLGGGH